MIKGKGGLTTHLLLYFKSSRFLLGVYKFETYNFEAGETKTITVDNGFIFLIHIQNYTLNLFIDKFWGGFNIVSASNNDYTSYLQITIGDAGNKLNFKNLRSSSDTFKMLIIK